MVKVLGAALLAEASTKRPRTFVANEEAPLELLQMSKSPFEMTLKRKFLSGESKHGQIKLSIEIVAVSVLKTFEIAISMKPTPGNNRAEFIW